MTAQSRVGDFGTILRKTVKDQDQNVVDVSGATTKEILLERPDGEVLTFPAVFYTDGTDGVIQYVTVDGDLDESGEYRYEGRVVLTIGDWVTSKTSFMVADPLTTRS